MALQKRDQIFMWAVVAAVPVVLMAVSFIFDPWSWGLMDDMSQLRTLRQESWWSAAGKILQSSFRGEDGKLTWLFYIYMTTFYPLFQNDPKAFYFFKLLITAATLGVWAFNVRLLTRSWAGSFLLCAVAFSFYSFYDAVVFLSSHEILGAFFMGLALTAFIHGAVLPIAAGKRCSWGVIALGWVAVFLAFGCKEPFVFAFLGLGLSLGVWSCMRRRWDTELHALLILAASMSYGFFLKFFIQKGYTARYDPTNFPVLTANLAVWFKTVAVFHAPWIALAVTALVLQWRRRSSALAGSAPFFGVLVGLSMYAVYLAGILPWQANSYHVVPLGVFFAFSAAVFLSKFLEEASPWLVRIIAASALIFEMAVCYHSFGAMAHYRNDTQVLVSWMATNHQFQTDMAQGWQGATNAWEPGRAVPDLLKREHGITVEAFAPKFNVKEIICDHKCVYYLYDPKLGDQDLRRLKEMWSVVFQSKSWILFRRSFWVEGC
jgi:hypothetical protein